jgi:hypothetical protein
MTVLLILGLGILMPKLAKAMNEKTDWSSLKQKGISFMVVAIGIYFIATEPDGTEKRGPKGNRYKPRQDGFKLSQGIR